jgi:CubicO group peptidase (beta-lactamase class C family)
LSFSLALRPNTRTSISCFSDASSSTPAASLTAGFLQERIFSPLQLNETGCDTNSNQAPQRAVGYRPSAHGHVAVEDYAPSTIVGAGNLYSSAGGLIRWTEALHGGRVLSSASLTEMTTAFLDGYGYGLEIDSQYGALDISHNGTVDGFSLASITFRRQKRPSSYSPISSAKAITLLQARSPSTPN